MTTEESNKKVVEAFNRAMESFDFERVHAFMLFTNKEWSDGEVPSVDRLKDFVRGLFINHVLPSERENSRATSGMFAVQKWTWDSGMEIEIICVFASSCSMFYHESNEVV